MKFDGFFPGVVLIILAVTVMFALYGDNFVTRSSSNTALQADGTLTSVPGIGVGNFPAPGVPNDAGAIANMQNMNPMNAAHLDSGGNAAAVQAMFGAPQQPGGPQFVAIANTTNMGMNGVAMDPGQPAMAGSPPPGNEFNMGMNGVAMDQGQPAMAGSPLPGNEFAPEVPPNFIPKNMAVDEAHWMGMDVRRLDSELRGKLRFPSGLLGILVGQVSMESSMSGLLGGDVITQVNNIAVSTLEEFQAATKTVKDLKESSMTVLRKTNVMDTAGRYQVRGMSLTLRTDAELGFAQLEGAPMILPGDQRPHPDRGPCTNCHAIGTGWELTPDPDMVTMNPPPITKAQADHKQQPHQDRGPCIACHIIKLRL